FNLTVVLTGGVAVSVEVAFQAAKEFESGGPFPDLLAMSPWEVKRDPRLRTSGRLRSFRYDNDVWDLEPKSAFYDWLYLKALAGRSDLGTEVIRYKGCTDIEFNPQKSINCQARSVALFV